MTLLTKTIRRELGQQFDRRNWIVELHPWGVRFRAKRSRSNIHDVTWAQCWNRANLNTAQAAKAARAEARKSKREAA